MAPQHECVKAEVINIIRDDVKEVKGDVKIIMDFMIETKTEKRMSEAKKILIQSTIITIIVTGLEVVFPIIFK